MIASVIFSAVTDVVYANQAHTAINCRVTLTEDSSHQYAGQTHPFTCVENDTAAHGSELWDELMAGMWGPIAPCPAETQDQILNSLAARRYAVENGGVTVAGNSYKTDSESRLALTAVFVIASANPGFTSNWKMADGTFVDLTASQITTAAIGILAFVQKCFDTEKNLRADIARYSTSAAIIAAFDQGMAA